MKVEKNPDKKICNRCSLFYDKKTCFCHKIDYYNENIESIVKLQKYFSRASTMNDDIMIDIIRTNIKKNNDLHNTLFMKCKKVLNMYPP